MQPADGQDRRGKNLARFVQRNCLWLLVACYALATVWPAPGRALRVWQWHLAYVPNATVTLPLLLLALLLFCAALSTDLSQVRAVGRRPWPLLAGLAAVWLGPALLVMLAAMVLPAMMDDQPAAELLVGMALVASMPVANSSVGWTQAVHGNLAVGLALVLATIFLCPWVTPWLLAWLYLPLSSAEGEQFQALIENFSGAFFIVWVILPTAAGMACRFLAGPRRVAAAAPWIAVVSVAALLMLNYVNAALAFPEVFAQSRILVLLTTALLAVALSAVGLAVGWGLARLLRLTLETRAALMFGLGMKHTGLALLLAGSVLAHERLAILMIVLATLAQHLLAGIVEWRMQPRP